LGRGLTLLGSGMLPCTAEGGYVRTRAAAVTLTSLLRVVFGSRLAF